MKTEYSKSDARNAKSPVTAARITKHALALSRTAQARVSDNIKRGESCGAWAAAMAIRRYREIAQVAVDRADVLASQVVSECRGRDWNDAAKAAKAACDEIIAIETQACAKAAVK